MRYSDEQVLKEAQYIVKNRATTRATGKHFGVDKATISYHVRNRLKQTDEKLYYEVMRIFKTNREVGHIKRGLATKEVHLNNKVSNRKYTKPKLLNLLKEYI